MEFRNGYFEELLRSPAVCDIVDAATERVAQKARADAPKSAPEYREGIVTAGKRQERYVGLVLSTVKGMPIEATTGNLARAVRGAGRGR